MAYASSQIKQENITRFCGKKCVQSAKKTYKPTPSKHETPSLVAAGL